MSTIRSANAMGVASVMSVLLIYGCSATPTRTAASAVDPHAAYEQRAVDGLRLKQQYKDIVMGTEIKGQTLVVYVDVNNLYSMDEATEDQMRSQTLAQWKGIWTRAHPHQHAKVRVSFRDYYGNEVVGETTRA